MSALNMQRTLWGIANKARNEPQARFRDLYRLLNVESLRDCYLELRHNAAVGVDRMSWTDYGEKLDENLHDLVQRLKEKRYRAKWVRRKHIPKGDGKTRPLGIPAIEDKIVQRGVSKILESIYEADFLECSWGYRPSRGAKQASRELSGELIRGRYYQIVEADIKGFFDTINHDQLLGFLALRINDGALLGLIAKWLKAGILEEDGRVTKPVTGSPQGGVVSPILANVYLHYVLDLWFKDVVTKNVQGEAMMIRYADDFVCAFEHREAAEAFMKVLPKRLGRFGLQVAPEKTNLIPFSRFTPATNGSFCFLGFQYHWEQGRNGKSKVQRRTDPKKLQKSVASVSEWLQANRHKRLRDLMESLKKKMRGYWNYYGVIGNYAQLSKFWWQVNRLLFKWLNRRSQKRSYRWAELLAALKRYQIPPPHITETYRTSKA